MNDFKATMEMITDVNKHPNSDKLGVSKLTNGKTIISSRLEDGSFRYPAGQLVVYCPEDAILPEKLLKMGYWDKEKEKGYLSGSKGNRVKNRKIADIISEGLIFPVESIGSLHADQWVILNEENDSRIELTDPIAIDDRSDDRDNMIGRDVTEKLGIIQYFPMAV